MRADPVVMGGGDSIINKYINIYIFIIRNLLLPPQGRHAPTPRKEGRRKDMGEEKKRKGIEAQRADPPNPSQASMRT